jgi:hypothetical protein
MNQSLLKSPSVGNQATYEVLGDIFRFKPLQWFKAGLSSQELTGIGACL